ncbi:MAG: hypothetical protein ABMB14_06500 [Myxococcota bacterium]
MRRMWLGWIVVFVGCNPETGWPGGTGVGNPGTTKLQTNGAGPTTLDRGVGTLSTLTASRCTLADAVAEIDAEVDLLGTAPYELGGGSWCTLTATFTGPLRFEGSTSSADPTRGTFELLLEVPAITIDLDAGFTIDRDATVLELGHPGWIPPDLLGGLEDRTHTVVDAGSPAHDPLVSLLVDGSAVFVDADGDGALAADERHPVGAGPSWTAEWEDDD